MEINSEDAIDMKEELEENSYEDERSNILAEYLCQANLGQESPNNMKGLLIIYVIINENNYSIVYLIDNENLDVDNSELNDNSQKTIWRLKRPNVIDIEATLYLLKLRGSEKYINLFNDTRNIKFNMWLKIAAEMVMAGYNVGKGRMGAERCRQKFSNLTKIIHRYENQCKINEPLGKSSISPPLFYDEIMKILKRSNYRKIIRRSSKAKGEILERRFFNRNDDRVIIDTRKYSKSEEEISSKNCSPNNVVDLVNEMFMRNKTLDNKFEKVCAHLERQTELLEEQNQQNEQIINLLEQVLKNKT